MSKISTLLLFLVMFLNIIVIAKKTKHDYGLPLSKTDRWLIGKGKAPCDKEIPQLSIAKESIINTKKEWDAFVPYNPLFVLATADSTCAECCTSEPFLRDLNEIIEDKKIFAHYTHKLVKQRKVIKAKLKLVRIDLSNKELVEELRSSGMQLDEGEEIMVVVAGKKFSYDGTWHDYKILLHYIQRLANPLIKLNTLKDILYFVEGADEPHVHDDDY